MDYKITIKLEDGLAKSKIDELKKQLSGIEGVKKIGFDASSIKDSFAKLGSSITGVNQGLELAKKLFFSLKSAVIDPAADFETLRVRLVNLYQDTEKANQVFEQFKEIAATTPYELRNVVEAGASLKAFGMNAEKSLKSVADLAAFMGVDVVEAASAVGRAFAGGAGAADILRERGVLELIKSFKGIDDLTKLTLPEFRQAMLDTFESPASGIAGATNLLSNTYTGAMSNMKDALTNFSASIGSMFTPAMASAARSFTDFITSITPVKTELEKVTDETINQQAEFTTLVSAYKSLRFEQNESVKENKSLKEIVSKLNEGFSTYLGNIDLATASYKDFEEAVKKANAQLIEETKIKILQATKKDMITEAFEKEMKQREKISKLIKGQADEQAELLRLEKDFQGKVTERARAQGASSATTASVTYSALEISIEQKKERIAQINKDIAEEQKKLNQEIDTFSKTYDDLLSKIVNPEKPDKDNKTGSIDDKLKKELDSLRRSLKEKEAILKEDYQTNQKFILANVKDKEEQTKLLSALDMKYANEYADLKKSENSSIKNIYQEQQKLHQELQEEKLKADNEYYQQNYALYEENQKAYDEFLTREYEMYSSSEERRKASINAFYNQYKSVLLDMGVTEDQIERQRHARLLQASESFQHFSKSVESGFDTMWAGITDKSLDAKRRWENVWKSMKMTAMSSLRDILKQKISDMVKTMALYKTETAAHAEKETTKTGITGLAAAKRIGIIILENAKEIAITIASGIKYVAVQIWKIGASIMKWFTGLFGPFGIPMAIASTIGAMAAINSLRKGFATGGYTGDGGKLEPAGVVHKGEVVYESSITRDNKNELLGLRALMQKGYKLKDLIMPSISFPVLTPAFQGNSYASGGYVSGSSQQDGYEKLIDEIRILNANLVDKENNTFISIQTSDSQAQIRKERNISQKMKQRGEKV